MVSKELDDFCDEIDKLFVIKGFVDEGVSFTKQCGRECFADYLEDGDSPEDVLRDEMEAAYS